MSFCEFAADALLTLRGKDPSPRTAAIIVAAGSSTRMGKGISKQFLALNGIPVLAHTLRAFQASRYIDEIVVVARAEDIDTVRQLAKGQDISKLTHVVRGGDTRAASVQNGFRKIHPKTKYVAIHDGARCLITTQQIAKVCRAAYRHRAATAACGVVDTVKMANKRGFIATTIDRNRIFLAQTPQVFHADLYRGALAYVKDDHITDDNQLMERIKHPVKLVDCGKENIKITTPDDIEMAEYILSKREVKK